MADREQIGTGNPDGMVFGSTFGSSALPVVSTYNGTKSMAMYASCASTNASTSWEPVYIGNLMSGTGQGMAVV